MLSEKIYQNASTEFGTAVGVANIIGYRTKTDHITEYTPDVYKTLSDNLDVNYIICEAVDNKLYIELQREIYNIRLNNKRIKKELSIYKKAWNNINGNKTNKSKRREVLEDRG